jgi:hypothetical protein
MTDQDTVGQRFVQLIAHLGISKNAFAASIGKTATVIQHLVDERNKPGFDLLNKVFEVYPNVSIDWIMKGTGSMLVEGEASQQSVAPEVLLAPAPEKKPAESNPAPALAAEKTLPKAATIEPPAPSAVHRTPDPIAAPSVAPTPVAAPEPIPATAPVAAAPVAAAQAPAPAADTSWQTALYTQQMAHQLALAELRNQHLQEQQRLMQQMLDLMQRQLA